MGGETLSFELKTYPTNSNAYKFEAERGIIIGDATISRETSARNPSGGAYIGKISGNEVTITLNITSDRDIEALFIMNVGCRNTVDFKFNDGRELKVNDELVSVSDNVIFYKANSSYDWFNWHEYDVAMITLKAGVNKIDFINKGKKFTNLDYFKIISSSTLDWYFEV